MGRECELSKIQEILSQKRSAGDTAICFLRGAGGIGKTQLALNYASNNARKYQQCLFIDCENTSLFDNSLENACHQFDPSFTGKPNEYLVYLKDRLVKAPNFILIVDNVDRPELAALVQQLIPEKSKGHVVITGRYDLKLGTRLQVGKLTEEHGRQLFRKMLPTSRHAEFDRFDLKDINQLVSKDLDGSPLAIRLAALYFKVQSIGRDLCTPSEYRKLLTSLNPIDMKWVTEELKINSDELGYFKSIHATYIHPLKLIQENSMFQAHPEMVNDVLRFLAFFGTLQNIPFPQDMNVLSNIFLNTTQHPQYQRINIEEFARLFRFIVNQFNECSLIQISEDQAYIEISLPVKWAVQYDFLTDLEKVKNRENNAALQKKVDVEKFNWFLGGFRYLNQTIANPNQIDGAYLTVFMSFVNFFHIYKLSGDLKAKFINEMKIWQVLDNALENKHVELLEELKKLPRKELYDLLTFDDKYNKNEARAIARIGQLFVDSDPSLAESLYSQASKRGDSEVLASWGNYYLLQARRAGITLEDRGKTLEKAIEKYSEYLRKVESSAEIFNNRGVCYLDMGQLDDARADFDRAVSMSPYEAIYYRHMAQTCSGEERSRLKKLAENMEYLIKQPEFPKLSKSYRKVILEYFKSEDTFILKNKALVIKELWPRKIDDGGVFFGKMINRNDRVSSIKLSNCSLSPEGLQEIGKSLASNRTLQRLSIKSDSTISYDGVKQLAQGLAKNRSLTFLKFKGCSHIKSIGFCEIIEKCPPQLKQIDLKESLLPWWLDKGAPQVRSLAAKKGIQIIE